jgi:hypothetical protein
MTMADPINPDYYKGVLVIPKHRLAEFTTPSGDISLEYMDLMEFVMTPDQFEGHLKGQVWKYLLRLGGKDDPVQEVKKSSWYLTRLVKFITGKK